MLGFFADLLGTGVKEEYQNERQEDSQQFNSGEAAITRGWQEQMRATQYQTAIKDMQAAGLNPMLAYHQGGAGVPTGATASSGIGGGGGSTNFAASQHSAAQVDVAEAAADKLKAEADEIRARTPRHEWDIEEIKARIPKHHEEVNHLRQQIGESAVRIEKIWQETRHLEVSAANIEQQTKNLEEAIHLIKAQVKNYHALTDQSAATTTEIKQRVKANLPEIDRILKDIEETRRKLDMPKHAADSDVYQSLWGKIARFLHAINPLQGIIATK